MTEAPTVPQRLGKYWIVAPLGQGGMARVDLAVEDGASDVVVLKQLHESLESHSDVTKRFLREATVASMLDHPNIARVLDAGVEEGHRCLAMEFVAGLTFEEINQHYWKQKQSMPPKLAVALLRQMLEALEYAHGVRHADGSEIGLVHRDLSTKNLLLNFRGQVKIIDFGIAKGAVDDHRTATGMLMGTPLYMSPEQARGQRVDRRSDLYTAGVVLWEMLAGRRLIQAKGRAAMLRAVVAEAAPPLREVAPEVPAALAPVLAKALNKDVEFRFQDAAEFLRALVPAAAEVGLVTPGELADYAQSVLPARKAHIDRQWADAMRIAEQEGLTRLAYTPTGPAGLTPRIQPISGAPAGPGVSTAGPGAGSPMRAPGTPRPAVGTPAGQAPSEVAIAPPTDWSSAASMAVPARRSGLPSWLVMGVLAVVAVGAGAAIMWPEAPLEVTRLEPLRAGPVSAAASPRPTERAPAAASQDEARTSEKATSDVTTAGTTRNPDWPARPSEPSTPPRRGRARSPSPSDGPTRDSAPSQVAASTADPPARPDGPSPTKKRLLGMLRRYQQNRDVSQVYAIESTLVDVPDLKAPQKSCINGAIDGAKLVGSFRRVEEVAPWLKEAIDCID